MTSPAPSDAALARQHMADLDLLITAARAAGEIAVPVWQRSHDVWDKGDGAGPVTEADLAVDRMLHDMLGEARPDYGWLSEETEDAPARQARRLSSERVFVIDPIDGTRSFTAGERTWAHSLAVVERGQPVAAVVYLPLRDKLYTAAAGQGAWLNGVSIAVSQAEDLDTSTMLAARPAMDPEHWQPGRLPPIKRAFRTSLAYRLSLVAEGRFDAMLTLRNSWEWDIAAGALIAQEAGAAVSDRFGAPLRFNSARRYTRGVLLGTPAIHAALLDRLPQAHARHS